MIEKRENLTACSGAPEAVTSVTTVAPTPFSLRSGPEEDFVSSTISDIRVD